MTSLAGDCNVRRGIVIRNHRPLSPWECECESGAGSRLGGEGIAPGGGAGVTDTRKRRFQAASGGFGSAAKSAFRSGKHGVFALFRNTSTTNQNLLCYRYTTR